MDELEGAGCGQCDLVAAAKGVAGGAGHQRTHAFTATENRVAHGVHHGLGDRGVFG